MVHPGSSRDGAGARVGSGCVVYIDLEALVPPSGIPKPGPLQMHLPDDHMRYAIIWFSLAGLLLIAFAVSLRGRMPAPS